MLAKHIGSIYGKGLFSAKGLRCGEKHYTTERGGEVGSWQLAVVGGQLAVEKGRWSWQTASHCRRPVNHRCILVCHDGPQGTASPTLGKGKVFRLHSSSGTRGGGGLGRRVLADGPILLSVICKWMCFGLSRRRAGDCEPYLGERKGVSAVFGEWNERW